MSWKGAGASSCPPSSIGRANRASKQERGRERASEAKAGVWSPLTRGAKTTMSYWGRSSKPSPPMQGSCAEAMQGESSQSEEEGFAKKEHAGVRVQYSDVSFLLWRAQVVC